MTERAQHAYVFIVVGDCSLQTCATAIRYLRHFSRASILVLMCRCTSSAPAGVTTLPVCAPAHLDDRAAQIHLKTRLLDFVEPYADMFCYLDNDVIAVSDDADSIFQKLVPPVAFAPDHSSIDEFSRWAINCGCTAGPCEHLRDEISAKFGVRIENGLWRQWNAGVFVFNRQAYDLLSTWTGYADSIHGDARWKIKDQGTLAASVWRLGLQDHPTLPQEFNFIVDRMKGLTDDQRTHIQDLAPVPQSHYSLNKDGTPPHPKFIHFINGGVGHVGWRNWDDVAALPTTPH